MLINAKIIMNFEILHIFIAFYSSLSNCFWHTRRNILKIILYITENVI